MLQNINLYGLSHLCDLSIFENTEKGNLAFSYPFLDIYFQNDIYFENRTFDVEFYSRGNKYSKTSFKNLFEYHIFNEQSGDKD